MGFEMMLCFIEKKILCSFFSPLFSSNSTFYSCSAQKPKPWPKPTRHHTFPKFNQIGFLFLSIWFPSHSRSQLDNFRQLVENSHGTFSDWWKLHMGMTMFLKFNAWIVGPAWRLAMDTDHEIKEDVTNKIWYDMIMLVTWIFKLEVTTSKRRLSLDVLSIFIALQDYGFASPKSKRMNHEGPNGCSFLTT